MRPHSSADTAADAGWATRPCHEGDQLAGGGHVLGAEQQPALSRIAPGPGRPLPAVAGDDQLRPSARLGIATVSAVTSISRVRQVGEHGPPGLLAGGKAEVKATSVAAWNRWLSMAFPAGDHARPGRGPAGKAGRVSNPKRPRAAGGWKRRKKIRARRPPSGPMPIPPPA